MRPIHLILNQIRWDPNWDPDLIQIVWEDHQVGEQTEPYHFWKAREDLPQHRIRKVIYDGKIVWDRIEKIDLMAG